MLQYVAVCCSVLQCVAVCCSVLQCVSDRYQTKRRHQTAGEGSRAMMLQFVVVCCSALQCVAVCCSVLQCFSDRYQTKRRHQIAGEGSKAKIPVRILLALSPACHTYPRVISHMNESRPCAVCCSYSFWYCHLHVAVHYVLL